MNNKKRNEQIWLVPDCTIDWVSFQDNKVCPGCENCILGEVHMMASYSSEMMKNQKPLDQSPEVEKWTGNAAHVFF